MTLPCIWMTAGLVTYKLCDRELDCEHCPLDAALRGVRPAVALESSISDSGRRVVCFPDDRLYTDGHTWLRHQGPDVMRLGLDGFAAALVGPPSGVSWSVGDGAIARGEFACELDLEYGVVPIASPVPGRVLRTNPALDRAPQLLAASPYDTGWLCELEPAAGAADGTLLDPDTARERAVLDLRHFRRQVALHLLADTEDCGPTLADGGEPLTDLRRILAPRVYLDLLRGLIH